MSGEEDRRERGSYRSTFRARSNEPDRDDEYRVRDRDDRRKRERSRSRDAPRKRRSLSPRDRHESRRDRDRWQSERRYDSGRDDRTTKRRKSRSASRSPPRRKQRSPEPFKRSKGPLPSQNDAFQKGEGAVAKGDPPPEKQKPNFGNSGRLAAASNTVQTGGQAVVLKYHEPAEARKPSAKDRWRMYVFKGDEILETIELFEQSCWLFGRETSVVDVLIEHSSCSKQHAVIQFRYIEKRNEFGDKMGKVRPYILDLESANQTLVNDHAIPEAKYVELRDKDVVKFGHSSREYVVQLPPSG